MRHSEFLKAVSSSCAYHARRKIWTAAFEVRRWWGRVYDQTEAEMVWCVPAEERAILGSDSPLLLTIHRPYILPEMALDSKASVISYIQFALPVFFFVATCLCFLLCCARTCWCAYFGVLFKKMNIYDVLFRVKILFTNCSLVYLA